MPLLTEASRSLDAQAGLPGRCPSDKNNPAKSESLCSQGLMCSEGLRPALCPPGAGAGAGLGLEPNSAASSAKSQKTPCVLSEEQHLPEFEGLLPSPFQHPHSSRLGEFFLLWSLQRVRLSLTLWATGARLGVRQEQRRAHPPPARLSVLAIHSEHTRAKRKQGCLQDMCLPHCGSLLFVYRPNWPAFAVGLTQLPPFLTPPRLGPMPCPPFGPPKVPLPGWPSPPEPGTQIPEAPTAPSLSLAASVASQDTLRGSVPSDQLGLRLENRPKRVGLSGLESSCSPSAL